MRVSRQIELLDRLVGVDVARPWTFAAASMRNPAAAYVDPGRFARELAVLFRGRPQFVGLSGECREPGTFLTRTLGGVPIAVVRQADGSLRAIVNACRHRGAPLLEGDSAGAVRRIVCPYHGWTYETDGRLVGRPGSAGAFDDLGAACTLDLHRRAVAEKHGMIFVHPESDQDFEVDDVLCGAQSELADYGLADYVHVETRTSTWKMNWKLFLDTFTESYHIRWLHRNSIAPFFLCDTIFDSFGPHARTIGLRKEVVDQLKDKPRDEWRLLPFSTAQYFLVPNALVVYQIDHIEVWRVTPLDVGSCRVATSLFAPTAPASDKARNYWKRNLDILLDVTGKEDFPLQERVQATLASGALPEVVYGRIELALIHLHRSINAAVDGPAAA
ncbi:MAG: aromatic ring-hydroxylating dioxygenase subunit alpha [Reyranellaceae bacterium]